MAFACTPDFSPERLKSVEGVEQLATEVLWAILPIWVAVFAGLILGWSWKPRWATLLVVALRSRPRLVWSIPPGFGARRLWLAATAAAAAPILRETLEAFRSWARQVEVRWREMQEHLKVFKPEEAAAFLPAGRLTKRAQNILFKESVSAAHPASLAKPSVEARGVPPLHIPSHGLSLNQVDTTGLVPTVCLMSESQQNTAPAAKLPFGQAPAAFGSKKSIKPSSPTNHQDANALLSGGLSPCSSAGSPKCSEHCTHGEVVSEEDLEDLIRRLEDEDGTKGGGQPWGMLMEKKTQRMTYTAWRRDPQNGPTEYRSRSVVEDCAPETMRDFFWDDDFRPEWDGMLAQWKTLEDCPGTGLQIVRWVRKFPLFCKDREYIIGRRIWSRGNTYYCITKGLAHHPEAPRKDAPRRVDHFYSSWRIQPLEDGSCEVLLFHQEDMGIQRDVAKMGIRQGMWGAVKKIEPGVRSFKRALPEKQGSMSRSLSMARLNTPVPELPSPGAAPRREEMTLGRARKWVSSSDLTTVGSSAGQGESPRGGQLTEANEHLLQDASARGGNFVPREAPGRTSVCLRDAVPSAAAAIPEDAVLETEAGISGRELMARECLELAERKELEDPQRRLGHRRIRLAVAATAVAVVCGVEAGLLLKLVLAAAVRHAVKARNRRS